VLDRFVNLATRDDTILELYRLAALANLQREEEALGVFDNLVKSRNQFLIQKYAPSILKKIENDKLVSIASALNFELKNVERPVNTRKTVETSTGIVRNRNLPLEIKKIYGSLCQVCRVSLATPFGLIAEAAHIQGLGHPHYGSDDISNLLCLCPNHHKLFDSSGWYLSDDMKVVDTLTKDVISELLVVDSHEISLSAISYQRNYAINASSKGQRAWS
jgi:predicted restriction endonuclease